MPIKLNDTYLAQGACRTEAAAFLPLLRDADEKIRNKSGAGSDYVGWIDLPVDYDREEVARIKKTAAAIQAHSDVFVVIGIGGSYLGAKAAIDFLRSPNYNTIRKRTPDIYFIGNSFSGSEILEVISLCEGKDVSVNVVSKSGTTTESAIAFRVMLSYMQSRYSKDELRRRRRECRVCVPPEPEAEHMDALSLREAVRALPEELRSVIVLRYFTGLTLEETAAALEIPRGTVSSRQRRALELLRLDLTDGQEVGS